MKFSNKLIAVMILLMAFALTSCPEEDKKNNEEVIVDEMTATVDITTSVEDTESGTFSISTETVTFDASDNIAFADGMISGTSASYTIEIHTDDAEVFFFSPGSSTISSAQGTAVDDSDDNKYTGSFTFSSESDSATLTCTDGVYTLGK